MLAGHVCNVFIQKNCNLSLFNGQVNFFFLQLSRMDLVFTCCQLHKIGNAIQCAFCTTPFLSGGSREGRLRNTPFICTLQEPFVVTSPLFEIKQCTRSCGATSSQQSHAQEDSCKLSRLSPSTADPQVTALRVPGLGQGKGKVGADLAAMNAERGLGPRNVAETEY